MNPETKTSSKLIIPEVVAWGLLGVLIRVAYVFWVAGKYGTTQFSDFLYLHRLAESIADGKGFTIDGVRIFNQSVGYPAFLSVFYRLFGSDVWTALVVNILLGGVSVALLYELTSKLFAGIEWEKRRTLVRLTALLGSVYPDSLLYCGLVSAENLLVPLLLMVVLSVVIEWKREFVAGVVVGGLAAMACSVKAHVLFFCIMIPFVWYIVHGRFLVRIFAATFAAIVCLLPWTILNYHASGGYVIPFGAVAGEVMLDGNNPMAQGRPTNMYHLPEAIERGKSPVELDRLRMKQALRYISDGPLWYARLCLKKAVFAFSPVRDFLFQFQEQNRFFGPFLSRWCPTVFNGFLLVAIMVGMILVRRKPDVLAVGCCLFGAQLILQIIFFAYSRYRFPFLFCLLPFCGMFMDMILRNMIRNEENGFPLESK